MKNLVSIIEIPTADFKRAIKFYKTILNIDIEEMTMGDSTLGVFPSDGDVVNIVLIRSDDYTPSDKGVLIYLSVDGDLQPTLDAITKNGGKILIPSTEISPEMGNYATFIDTEGNKLGLHSFG
jgi:predicted enzyme related to lactoylglutathione lyase